MSSTFSVHVFVNHDPFLASVFLPDLFANFPDAAWQLPKLVPFPERPPPERSELEGPGAPSAPWVYPRESLGRHIIDGLPGSTTVEDLGIIVERDFGIPRDLQAAFTTYPLEWFSTTPVSPWKDKPLPPTMTLADIGPLVPWPLDEEDQPIPKSSDTDPDEVHLVLETKAAALRRIVGMKFLETNLGNSFRFIRDQWNQLDSYNHIYHSRPYANFQLIPAITTWRHAKYALRYLQQQEEKQVALIGELAQKKQDAREVISTLVRWWADWLPHSSTPGVDTSVEIHDGAIEEATSWVWRTKLEIVGDWETSTRRADLANMLTEVFASRYPKMAEFAANQAAQTVQPQAEPEEALPQAGLPEPVTGPVQTRPFRDASGVLLAEHAGFNVQSGVLLWGQILPMYYGSLQQRFTGNASEHSQELPGGTVMQHVYTYRSAARNGRWKARRYFGSWDEHTEHVGWIFTHEDIDATDILHRLEGLMPEGRAISNGNGHIDKDVRYIGRYDWSYHWHNPGDADFETKFQSYAEEVIGPAPADPETESKINVKKSAYFTVIDADHWGLDFLKAYKQECEGDPRLMVERTFEADGQPFGSFVRMRTGYEFAWLIFSGKKDAKNGADELIGIVYDGAYETFEGLNHTVEPEPEV